MPDLIAKGPRSEDRWRRTLPEVGVEVTLGRISEPWAVSWDDRISRKHAVMRWNGQRLEIERLPQARNAIFYHGRKSDQFEAAIGEHFVIGQTSFTVLDQKIDFSQQGPSSHPGFAEQTFSANLLRNNSYKDAGRRIEALGKLPEIISSATSDKELCLQVVSLLLQGIPEASFVAIVKTDEAIEVVDDSGIDVLHWDCRSMAGDHFSPSARLVANALESGESVLHIWSRSVSSNPSFTQSENIDWAFCTPVVAEACPGWAIYVAGDFASSAFAPRLTPPPKSRIDDETEEGATRSASATRLGVGESDALQDDLKFTELVATTLGSLRQVRALQRRQDSLRNFFAPVVLDALAGSDPEQVLSPRETDVSVLFCDLRGFSRRSENESDQLLELLRRVSDALGVMTHHILSAGGVIGDFHGDAAMGFWGWPLGGEQMIEQSCRAALEIQKEFATSAAQADHPLAGFQAGLGIASGSAVAGRIGTSDQVKVTVFGPVVNLASRLESMTKQLQASILVDEPTAQVIREAVDESVLRIRKVAKVQPYGMSTPLLVSELLPPEGPDSILTNAHINAYEQALEQFIEGDWTEAFQLLHEVPAADRVKDFLTVAIAQHQRVAPPDWAGFIRLPSK